MDSRELRDAFGAFGTGVAIVTLCHGRDDAAVARGLTVNSLASVSLEPPLLSWCLDEASDMKARFAVAKQFCVNVLAANQLELSEQMSQPGEHILDAESFSLSEAGNALIDGALAYFECDVQSRIGAGDHIIYLGAVKHAICCAQTRTPLLYFRGQYVNLR